MPHVSLAKRDDAASLVLWKICSFALGNAVTGRGNIKESQVHGRKVSERVMDEFLAWREEDFEEIFKRAEENADLKIETIGQMLKDKDVLDSRQMNRLHSKIARLQKRVGYLGDYDNWINEHIFKCS